MPHTLESQIEEIFAKNTLYLIEILKIAGISFSGNIRLFNRQRVVNSGRLDLLCYDYIDNKLLLIELKAVEAKLDAKDQLLNYCFDLVNEQMLPTQIYLML